MALLDHRQLPGLFQGMAQTATISTAFCPDMGRMEMEAKRLWLFKEPPTNQAYSHDTVLMMTINPALFHEKLTVQTETEGKQP